MNKIHYFTHCTDGISLPSVFTYPFHYTPHPLTVLAAREVQSYLLSRTDWKQELHNGKMFGVLIIRTQTGKTGYLAAFSGNLAGSNNHEYFVPPVYDLLQPEGFFRKEEAQISQINCHIRDIEDNPNYQKLQRQLEATRLHHQKLLKEEKAKLKEAKQQREQHRKEGVTPEEEASLIKESQFQKAQFKRMERKLKDDFAREETSLLEITEKLLYLKEERKKRSATLQRKLFEQFDMLNAKGEKQNLCQIFQDTPQHTPPAGAGECALPKLLQYAYLNQLQPVAMGEFWWGMSPKEEIRHHGQFYPSCKGKCEPILRHMLTGLEVEKNPLETNLFKNRELEVVYEDQWMIAINKPAGMLSVPGKNDLDSVCQRLHRIYPEATGPLVVHRLDMATSGILLAAKTKEIHQALQSMFASREMKKEYTAILKGYKGPGSGFISLPLMPDWNNRPRQMVNYQNGKPSLTEYHVTKQEQDRTWVLFIPHTGRTHQLRVHAAHPQGMNAPIEGDELYGMKSDRLYLHATRLTFTHPQTGETVDITVPAGF